MKRSGWGVPLAAMVMALLLPGGPTSAQSLDTATPAEFPPASFRGSQYVDSRGCVYIRAGIDGNVTWIPRMTRQRRHICNAEPSRIAGAGAPAAPPAAAVQITLDAPVSAPPAPQSAGRAAARVATPVPAPAAPVILRAPEPGAAPATGRSAQVTGTVSAPPASCPRGSVLSARYTNSGDILEVRCGPQEVTTFAPRGQAVLEGTSGLPGTARIIPRHVATARAQAGRFTVPDGYKPAWSDGRLNPRRAEGTIDGRSAMNLVWTQTVPRRLIDRSTGADVTANVALVYPYTSMAVQQRELGTVTLSTRDGKVVKTVRRGATQSGQAPVMPAKPQTTPKRARESLAESR